MIKSKHQTSILASHQFQGKTNDCGPVCVAIILNAKNGTNINGLALGQSLNKIQWHIGLPRWYRIRDWITFPWGLTSYMRQYGNKARIRVGKSLDWAYQQVSTGRILIPIIGRWKPLWGHYLIPVAWEWGERVGFCNPAINSKEIDWMAEEKFIRYWGWLWNTVIEVNIDG